MAHLSSIAEAILTADDHYTADILALNNSGVTGTVLATIDENEILSVAVVARNLTPDAAHVQHVHGLFDENGDPANSVPPTGALDTDLDGFVEVAEGAAAYGDILLPLEDQSDGLSNGPMADAEGRVNFYEEYDLTDDSLFLNPLSGMQYEGADLLALPLREYVIHGLEVEIPVGAGTEGSIDGTTGYKLTLPVGAGEFEAIDRDEALDRLEDLMAEADPDAPLIEGTSGDDGFEGLTDGAMIFGNGGTDTLTLEGDRADYMVETQANGFVGVSRDGATAEIASVERIAFDDATLLFADGDAAEAIYLLYAAGLDRRPDADGFEFWLGRAEAGESLVDIAAEFVESGEFATRFGSDLDDAALVDVLFDNVLGRAGAPAGEAFWEDRLAEDDFGAGDALLAFALSGENRAQEAENISDGFLVA